MPQYEYKCIECGHVFDEIQRMDAPNPACPECSGKTERQISSTSFRLKGGGWYDQGYQK